jgi:MYXO-CTERM domain-containing protein
MNGKILISAAIAASTMLATAGRADAFCGFYINGAGSEMFNNATQVVLMRVGTRTVLSMQNNYQGPPSDFAMVVPVPVVLQEENVKTLPIEVFAKVDAMGAPRLVEYWEHDPCAPDYYDYDMVKSAAVADESCAECGAGGDAELGVKIEAQFKVGEYDIVILSAKDSTGLETWLTQEKYKIPAGAEPLLRPYVESGSKFFVAKVDPSKVRFENGMAALSPLRFHYDSEEFSLPIRLGLANSSGTQDLIVNVLSPSRYEVANRTNVFIPTNLEVKDEVRKRFGEFYAALFDRTLEINPGAVVTEYAWDAMTCDPCPGPTIDYNDLMTLGTDVVQQGGEDAYYGSFVLTRLHARYGKDDVKDDLVFRETTPVVGGREIWTNNALEERATASDYNNFQGRYIIRHEWTGPIECENPIRGRWGGPPDGQQIAAESATNSAFAPRGQVQLPMMVAEDVPEIQVVAGVPLPRSPSQVSTKAKGCGCASGGEGAAGTGALFGLLALVLVRKRKHP